MRLGAKLSMYVTGKYLLDTNIVIALLNGEQSIRNSLEQAEEVLVPVIAVGSYTLVLRSQGVLKQIVYSSIALLKAEQCSLAI